MSATRFWLTAIGLAALSFVIWLSINLVWPRAWEMAFYGAFYGAVGVVYGLFVARYWLNIRRREDDR